VLQRGTSDAARATRDSAKVDRGNRAHRARRKRVQPFFFFGVGALTCPHSATRDTRPASLDDSAPDALRSTSSMSFSVARALMALLVIGYGGAGCAEWKERAILRSKGEWQSPLEGPVPEDRERQTAVLRVGAATRHLDKCEIEQAGQDLERAVAFYEGRSWLFDVGYARALIARGRLRQLSNDNAAAVTDFNKGIFILGRHEAENAGLMLGASWRLADCYESPADKEQRRAVLETALGFAARRLKPIEDARSLEIDSYSSVLALLERYELVTEASAASQWDRRFDVHRWKWGESWDPASSDMSIKADETRPSCRLSDKISDAPAVAEDLYGSFRRCFERTSAKSGSFQGITRLWVRVGTDGSIRGLRGISIGIPRDCNECLTRAVTSIRFKSPIDESVGIEFPVIYTIDPR